MSQLRDLIVIIPVYNEEAAIEIVLSSWAKKLEEMKIDYQIHVYNDGSRDNTLNVVYSLAKDNPRIEVHDKANSGHGQTILLGYNENCSQAEWLFQIDSDNEMGPEGFDKLWNKRIQYDFLLGSRAGRSQPLSRKIVTLVSRIVIGVMCGSDIYDVNSPYRLMRSSVFSSLFFKIPADTFAPNVIISGLAIRNHLRIYEAAVVYSDRTTGEVSIKKWKLLKAAAKSFWQTITFFAS
ncbi:MAG: hypothetical protein A2504_13280 [Bdellovibrionales bacterium RIFOXYD12_FULL_39_22]|nr:MAG: hypothetical protein A2385_01080 [Bdellovibrionales bacterium RIFOXYB1_FULL_39_21]OFZ43599.1 MAG: hypothetical protein A2485_12750 [Bdellovibrionales bacterium RIFOXYC12_FULL_39_17]OFZ44618.1 MAG: hypothetical protein A2404_10440 [Bdellovibrionales bacterium RIFOXYC1_FULL_39_130]OFZ76377.1 MAG: hypothetical protein A2560_07060 [Bdellovibrionales bacterium RIFOXYD1_FULL_39_84]OFZ94643.1 MAG: hypothetical protein A2504_13280 [Bdellovibrionales bacterium RIFOXYD12_FULL_39_22]HLE12900.1 gl